MLPVSAAFLAALRDSHTPVSQCLLLTPPGVTGTNLVGQALKVISGSVTLDYTANPRGTCDVTVKEPWPTGNSTGALVPYGTEIQLARGISYGNGTTEFAPLGIYRLSDVEQADAPKGALRLTGQDRMQLVIDSLVFPGTAVSPYFTAGTTVGAIVDALIGQVYPWASQAAGTIVWDDLTTTGYAYPLPRGLFCDQDRFGFLDSLVKSLGKVWYFDYRGKLIVKTPATGSYSYFNGLTGLTVTVSSPGPAIVWTADAGPQGVLVRAQRNLTKTNVYNTVVILGQALDNIVPPAVVVQDTDPTSVTYVGTAGAPGAFGVVPFFDNNTNVTDQMTALAAAATRLQLIKGLPYVVGFEQVPNPALEPYDLIQLVYPIDLTQVSHQTIETHYLQQLTFGLGSDTTMTAATRLSTNSGKLQ